MIILLEREGQMCNQLLSLAAVYSLSAEYQDKLICPVIDENLKNNFAFKNDNSVNVKMYYSRIWYIVALFLKAIKKCTRFKGMQKYRKGRRLHVFFSWISYLDNAIFVKHVKDIRSFFKMNQFVEDSCERTLKCIKQDNVSIVGVHLRRGDYREFRNGKYYYDDNRIIDWLQQLSENTTKPIHFLLCSNEKIDCEKYRRAGLSVSQPGKSSIEDLCLLSKSDYVMGPPSTYSFWAAMYGNKPRCILDDSSMDITWKDFRYFEERIKEEDFIR